MRRLRLRSERRRSEVRISKSETNSNDGSSKLSVREQPNEKDRRRPRHRCAEPISMQGATGMDFSVRRECLSTRQRPCMDALGSQAGIQESRGAGGFLLYGNDMGRASLQTTIILEALSQKHLLLRQMEHIWPGGGWAIRLIAVELVTCPNLWEVEKDGR